MTVPARLHLAEGTVPVAVGCRAPRPWELAGPRAIRDPTLPLRGPEACLAAAGGHSAPVYCPASVPCACKKAPQPGAG